MHSKKAWKTYQITIIYGQDPMSKTLINQKDSNITIIFSHQNGIKLGNSIKEKYGKNAWIFAICW